MLFLCTLHQLKCNVSALHIAAYYGQGLLIDLLIQNNAVVDATDYLGLTPLHLACQRGYQNVMVGVFTYLEVPFFNK